MKKKFLCTYKLRIYSGVSPFVVALAAGVNSNPSSRERFFLRTANPRQDPNNCIHCWLTRSVLQHTGDQARSVE